MISCRICRWHRVQELTKLSHGRQRSAEAQVLRAKSTSTIVYEIEAKSTLIYEIEVVKSTSITLRTNSAESPPALALEGERWAWEPRLSHPRPLWAHNCIT